MADDLDKQDSPMEKTKEEDETPMEEEENSVEVAEKTDQILSLTAKDEEEELDIDDTEDSAAMQMAERSKRTDASGSVPPSKDSVLARKAELSASAPLSETQPGAMSVGPSNNGNNTAARTKRIRQKAQGGSEVNEEEEDAAVVAHAMSIGAGSSVVANEGEEDGKPKAKSVPTLNVPPPAEGQEAAKVAEMKSDNIASVEQFKDEAPALDKEEDNSNDNTTQEDNSDLYTIEATVVPSETVLQEQARQQILNEAVEAKVLKIEDDDAKAAKRNTKKWILIIGILLVVAALIGIILGVVLSQNDSGGSSTSSAAKQQDAGPTGSPPPPGPGGDDPFTGGNDDPPPPQIPSGCSPPQPGQTEFLDVDGNVIPPPNDEQGNPKPYPTDRDGNIKPPPQDENCNYLNYPDKPPRGSGGGGGPGGGSGGNGSPPPPNRRLRGLVRK